MVHSGHQHSWLHSLKVELLLEELLAKMLQFREMVLWSGYQVLADVELTLVITETESGAAEGGLFCHSADPNGLWTLFEGDKRRISSAIDVARFLA